MNGFPAFLFGNVDEEGKLENEEWDQELKQTLQASASIFKDLTSNLSISIEKEEALGRQQDKEASIKPAPNAIDFTDMNEEAEDETNEKIYIQKPVLPKTVIQPSIERQPEILKPKKATEEEVKKIFPDFEKNKILKFSQIFSSNRKVQKSRFKHSIRPSARIIRDFTPFILRASLSAQDETQLFNSDVPLPPKRVDKSFFLNPQLLEKEKPKEMEIEEQTDQQNQEISQQDPLFHPVTLNSWEDEIIWEEKDLQKIKKIKLTASVSAESRFKLIDYEIEIGDWEQNVIWDESDSLKRRKIPVEINMNDPHLAIEVTFPFQRPFQFDAKQEKTKTTDKKQGELPSPTLFKPPEGFMLPFHFRPQNTHQLDRFNISNDRYYETLKKPTGGRVRQMLGKSEIQHSLPALRLFPTIYKRNRSKSELRSFHRPQLKINPNEQWKFQKVKNLKKKKVKGKDVTEILATIQDLSLKDNSYYSLFEYAEEYPPLLSNVGMGSFILNYYRKKDEKDTTVPKLPEGMPTILEAVDASPFFQFGDVPGGQTRQALKNHLYIAPLFKQELAHEDFLLIKYTFKNQSVFYLRSIPTIYAVGQTYPLSEVPPPQSRKIKTFIRDRLKVAAMTKIRKKGRQSKYPIHRLINDYHRYHDQSLRKHLKDTFTFQKSSKSNKWYLVLKDQVDVPSQQELFKLVTPEMVCIFESMRVGQQRLADCGYGTGIVEDQEEEEVTQMDDEVQLAPWNTTRNFILATQQKGMIQVYGTGDPTGRGEGFSFFRFSMKEMFLPQNATEEDKEAYYQSQVKTGHRFSLMDQQRFYRQEIERIWQAQFQALSSLSIPEISDSDFRVEEEDEEKEDLQEMMMMIQKSEFGKDDDVQSIASSSLHKVKSKGLLIRRLIKTETGKEEWVEEIITDVRIINAYLKQKRIMEALGTAEQMEDDVSRKKRIEEEIRQLKRSSGLTSRDMQPKLIQVIDSNGEVRMGNSKRRCKGCGQTGHIMTNKSCPNFAINFPERVKKEEVKVRAKDGKITISASILQQIEEKKKQSSTTSVTTPKE